MWLNCCLLESPELSAMLPPDDLPFYASDGTRSPAFQLVIPVFNSDKVTKQ